MQQQPGVWGIEIGQCAFKALRLVNIDGQVTATAFDYIEHPKILNQPDADPDQLTREALEKFLERNQLKGDKVVIGVPGQSGLARFVKLPPVEEKKITDIVRFEAKQQIPFPLEEVIWDYQKVGTGLVTDGFAMETEIGLFAMKRDMIFRFLQQFTELGIEVHVIQMSPLALCNFIGYSLLGKSARDDEPAEDGENEAGSTAIKEAPDKSFKRRCVVGLDIGTDNTNLVITDGDRIIWQRPIPKGGNHFTRALTKEFKLTFAKAEHLKKNATKSPDLRRILTALKPELNEFVGEVQRSLGYFTNTHRDAHVEYVMGMGNAFRLPGLQKYLSEKLQIDVRKLSKIDKLAGESVVNAQSFANNVMSFATVHGLALQGLGEARLQTNLLPTEIHMERVVRAKKPWAVATAAALLVGVTATLAGYAIQYHAVASESVKNAKEDVNKFMQRVKGDEEKYSQLKRRVDRDEEDVRQIVAGEDERLNWILFNQYINECIPVPAQRIDGKLVKAAGNQLTLRDASGKEQTVTLDASKGVMQANKWVNPADLQEGQQLSVVYQEFPWNKPFWDKTAARDAYLAFCERQRGSSNGADTEGVRDLIQFNIKSVSALYTPDLKGYFSNAQSSTKDKPWMPDKIYVDGKEMEYKDRTVPPGGAGWVVEIQGYTFHRDRAEFVRNTIVESLASQAVKPGAAAATNKPPGGSRPAPAPTGAANPAQPKPDENKPKDPFDNAIANRVSHVMLYAVQPDEDFDKHEGFVLLRGSVLPGLVGSGWSGGASPVGPGGLEEGPRRSPMGPGNLVPPPIAPEDPNKKPSTGLTRTEFIILLIWIENL
ncbi:MAG: type IV pilus assembly protein PilM, partial [Gemmataceae bacterium]